MKVLKVAAIVIGAAALIATGVGAAAGINLGVMLAATAGSLGVSTAVLGGVLLGAAGIALSAGLEAIAPRPAAGGVATTWKATVE